MARRRITFDLNKACQQLGDRRLSELLRRSRKNSFRGLMTTEPQHINLPIPATLLLTASGEFYLFVFTVRYGSDQRPYAKTAELFGPLDPKRSFDSQVSPRYGWADVQDYGEINTAYQRLDSLDVSFYYILDLRDLLSSQESAIKAAREQDADTLVRLCPPWELA